MKTYSKFENVDVIGALRKIMLHNTKNYQTDFEYDIGMLTAAARSGAAHRSFLWMSRDDGTWCFPARDVYMSNTPAHHTWSYYSYLDSVKAFWIELDGLENGVVMGTIAEMDHQKHVEEMDRNNHWAGAVEITFRHPHHVKAFDLVEYNELKKSILARHGSVETMEYLSADESKADLYVDYINESILPRIDYGALQQSYETADKSYAKGILNHLHEAMVQIYGAETLRPDYNQEMEENFVVIPGVVQGKKTGKIALALLELDLSSSGEHWGTSFLCKYGVLPQSGGKLPTDTAAPFVNAFIPYDYGYTADIPNDIHIRRGKLPDGIKDMLATFKEHTAELLPPEPPRYTAENPPQDENEDDLER